MARRGRTGGRRRADRRQRQSSVVRQRLGDDPARGDRLAPYRRDQCLGRSDAQAARQRPATRREPCIDWEREVQLRGARTRTALYREHQRQGRHQVRCNSRRDRPALGLEPTDEPDVSRREVAEPAVEELGRCGRGGAAEVACVDEGDAQAVACRFVRDPASDNSTADDQQVEPLPAQTLERDLPSMPRLTVHRQVLPPLPMRAARARDRPAPGRQGERRCRTSAAPRLPGVDRAGKRTGGPQRCCLSPWRRRSPRAARSRSGRHGRA